MEPLYCFAISTKRYALFNLDSNGNQVLRKASAHGLGHLVDPYSEADAPLHLDSPKVPLNEIGIKRWQHDFEAQEQIFETVIAFYDKHLNGMGTSVSRTDQ